MDAPARDDTAQETIDLHRIPRICDFRAQSSDPAHEKTRQRIDAAGFLFGCGGKIYSSTYRRAEDVRMKMVRLATTFTEHELNGGDLSSDCHGQWINVRS
jgi:hypothetical protein